jgi:hypothetical protein
MVGASFAAKPPQPGGRPIVRHNQFIYLYWFATNGEPKHGVHPRKYNNCSTTWNGAKPDDLWAHACTKCENTSAGFRELRLETCARREEMVGQLRPAQHVP